MNPLFLQLYNDEYIAKGKSTATIAKEQGINLGTLSSSFRRSGLPLRNNLKDYTGFRPYAFDTWTNEMAYWLGFIAADGSVYDRGNYIHVTLHSADSDHLHKLRRFLGLSEEFITPVKGVIAKTGKPREATRLGFASEHIKSTLSSYGVVPSKSDLDIDFLSYVPSDFKLCFILGYFDGDGGFTLTSTGLNPKFSFVGSFSFMSSVQIYLRSLGFSVNSTRDHSGGLYEIGWSGIGDILHFCELYKQIGDLSLTRKREKALLLSTTSFPKCTTCGCYIGRSSKSGLCSSCSLASRGVKNKPTAEELRELMKTTNFSALGRKYGVSDNAVRKWARKYGLLD